MILLVFDEMDFCYAFSIDSQDFIVFHWPIGKCPWYVKA